MSWDFNDDRPIYMQLMEQIQLRIVSGIYKAGEKLPSVRDMAGDAAVNPNTMQKALTELERKECTYSCTLLPTRNYTRLSRLCRRFLLFK